MTAARISLPLKKLVDSYLADNYHSPDIPTLTRKSAWEPVFVYGTEKYKFSHSEVMQDMPRVGLAYTTAPTFAMYNTKDHEPVALRRPIEPYAARISGEIYLVTPEVLFELDSVKENTVYFNRIRMMFNFHSVEQRDAKLKTPRMASAWIYIGVDEMFNYAIKDGNVRLMEAYRSNAENSRLYYAWTKKDDAANLKKEA